MTDTVAKAGPAALTTVEVDGDTFLVRQVAPEKLAGVATAENVKLSLEVFGSDKSFVHRVDFFNGPDGKLDPENFDPPIHRDSHADYVKGLEAARRVAAIIASEQQAKSGRSRHAGARQDSRNRIA